MGGGRGMPVKTLSGGKPGRNPAVQHSTVCNVGLWSIALQKSLQSELDSFPGKGVPLEWPRRHPKAFGIH